MNKSMKNVEDSKKGNKRPLVRLGLCCAIGLALALGVFLRIEDLIAWREKPQMAFYKGTPLLTTFDGLLTMHVLLVTWSKATTSPWMNFATCRRIRPDRYHRRCFPCLLAGIAKLTGASVDWVSTLFPPVFGVLLFFPVFLLGRLWGNTFTGIAAGLLSLCSPYYVNRSRLGWLDTDCGNVTFTMLAVYLAIRSVTTEGRRQQ